MRNYGRIKYEEDHCQQCRRRAKPFSDPRRQNKYDTQRDGDHWQSRGENQLVTIDAALKQKLLAKLYRRHSGDVLSGGNYRQRRTKIQ